MTAQFIFGMVVGFTVIIALLILRQPTNNGVPGIPVYFPAPVESGGSAGWAVILIFVLLAVMAFAYYELP